MSAGHRMSRWMLVWLVALTWSSETGVRAAGLSFYWYFNTQSDFTLPRCGTLDIGLVSNPNATTPPVPPYYLISYTAGNTPAVYSVGNGPSFTWQVTYAVGTQVLMSFVDSQGNSGGVGPLYSVVSGTNNACPSNASSSSPGFTFSTNPSSQPSTCQVSDITPVGGTPPYVLTRVVSGDSPTNETFSNASISYRNTLTGGATYYLALSDAQGRLAATSNLISSGGGSDTSCLVSSPETSVKSGNRNSTDTGDSGSSNEGGHRNMTGIIAGAVGGIAVAIVAGAFVFYRKRTKKQQEELVAAARANALHNGGISTGGISPSAGGAYLGHGREKDFNGYPTSAGGMWRPESPVEYPGIAGGPVKFRVTNPDDDAASRFSIGMGGIGGRHSEDTIRSSNNRRRMSGGSGSYAESFSPANSRAQRQSLIEGDHNALYPPTGSHFSTTTASSGSRQRAGSGSGSGSGERSAENLDEAWPTYISSASSTEDHYMDHPASSAGLLSGKTSANGTAASIPNSGPSSTAGGRSQARRQVQPAEMDLEEMSSDGPYNRFHGQGDDHAQPYEMTRTDSTFSANSWESPFADSRRVQR